MRKSHTILLLYLLVVAASMLIPTNVETETFTFSKSSTEDKPEPVTYSLELEETRIVRGQIVVSGTVNQDFNEIEICIQPEVLPNETGYGNCDWLSGGEERIGPYSLAPGKYRVRLTYYSGRSINVELNLYLKVPNYPGLILVVVLPLVIVTLEILKVRKVIQ